MSSVGISPFSTLQLLLHITGNAPQGKESLPMNFLNGGEPKSKQDNK